jgi:hypothetical protein
MTLPEVDFELETWRMVLFWAGPRAILDADPAEQPRAATRTVPACWLFVVGQR